MLCDFKAVRASAVSMANIVGSSAAQMAFKNVLTAVAGAPEPPVFPDPSSLLQPDTPPATASSRQISPEFRMGRISLPWVPTDDCPGADIPCRPFASESGRSASGGSGQKFGEIGKRGQDECGWPSAAGAS